MTGDDSFARLNDDDYPAYTIGRAADMIGSTQGFLRAIGDARLITPLRSEGGRRRYSRYQLQSLPGSGTSSTRARRSRLHAGLSRCRASSNRPSHATNSSAPAPPTDLPPEPRAERGR